MNKRSIIIIIVAILLIAIIAGLVYYFFFRKPPVLPEEVVLTSEERARLTLSEEEIERGLTLEQKVAQLEEERRLQLERGEEITPVEVEFAAVKNVVEEETSFATLSPDRKSIFYFNEEEGELYISELDGSNPRAITAANLKNVWDINWSKNKDKAIIAFSENEGKDKEYMLFDLRTQSTISYDKKYQGVTLSPEGDKISYLYRDEENDVSNISIADPDTTNFEILYSYPDKNIEINWFEDNYLEFESQDTGFKEGEVVVTDTEGKTYRVIVSEDYGVNTLYSPDGNFLIFTKAEIKNPRKLALYYTDKHGMMGEKYLGLDTLVEKCAWAFDNKTVYCGVPDYFADNMVMPNDYYNGKFISTDSFYKIDLESQRAELIAKSDTFEETYDIFQPFLSEDGKVFYFYDRIGGELKALTIPD